MKAQFLSKLHSMSSDRLLEICFQMAEVHPETFEALVLGTLGTVEFDVPLTAVINGTPTKVRFTPPQVLELRTYGYDRKVTCIKRIREITGLGLKEAKDLCEAEFIK